MFVRHGHAVGSILVEELPAAPQPAEPEELELELEEAEAVEESDDELDTFTVAELKAELDALGVEYDPRARKAELQELVRAAEEGG